MTTKQYVFRVVEVEQVVDGDTYDLVVDVGFHLRCTIRVRLLGYDTPELHHGSEFEREQGERAKEIAEQWWGTMALGGRFWVRTEKDPDSFGRWLGDVWVEDDISLQRLGDTLLGLHLATAWPTRWHEVYDVGRDGLASET